MSSRILLLNGPAVKQITAPWHGSTRYDGFLRRPGRRGRRRTRVDAERRSMANFRLTRDVHPGRLSRAEGYREMRATVSGMVMNGFNGFGSARKRAGCVAALCFAAFVHAACGSEDAYVLTVYNTLESTEAIRVDLAGDARELPVGAYTEFRSVKPGTYILSVESPTCSGVDRNSVDISADTMLRYRAERNAQTGACAIASRVEDFRSETPAGP